MNILFIGDIVGKLGRVTTGKILPSLKKRDNISLVIPIGENLAHGRGANRRVLEEVKVSGVDFFTSGDHIFDKEDFKNEIEYLPILKPANFPKEQPGFGYYLLDLKETGRFLVISLVGRTFIENRNFEVASPFTTVDAILEEYKDEKLTGILVDFHAEATSEKVAMGWYLDGRVSAVLGTHTHVPTADCRILPGGTAFVSDVGMVGARDGVLGVEKDIIVNRFLNPEIRESFQWVEKGPAVFNSLLIEIDDKTGKAISIKRVDELSD